MGQHPCNGCLRREEGRGTAVFLKIMVENFKFDEKDLCAFPKRSVNPKHGKYSHIRVKLVQATEKNLERQQETNSLQRGGASVLLVADCSSVEAGRQWNGIVMLLREDTSTRKWMSSKSISQGRGN